MKHENMEELKLNINQDYAKRFHKTKERAELFKLKQKFGEDAYESESSTSESEDEAAKEVTVQKERDFLKVLSLIKKKDPAIYDKTATFYIDEGVTGACTASDGDYDEGMEKPKKPIYLKDYERQRLLEKGSLAFVSDEESEDDKVTGKENGSPSYVEEQKSLKESFKVALKGSEDHDDGDEFLQVREKTATEKEQEECDYTEWLRGNEKYESRNMPQLETLKRYWTDPNLDEDESFLRDYILNRDYVDKDVDRIPTYHEIVGDDEEDEEEVEKQEEFERKFNFRYEEPDAEFVKSYPRTVSGSVRRKDERRKGKRKQRDERKEKEKEQKREELKRLKNLKRKEIMEKLEKIKEITGNPNVGFSEEDLEADFDPVKYDEAMKNMFDDSYYDGGDEEKPEFEDDLQDDEGNWDDWPGIEEGGLESTQVAHGAHSEDPGFNMDADYEENVQHGNMASTGSKPRGLSRFAQALHREKPTFNPDEKTFEEYFDEYYKLDYEDIVGDLPCRFKYRQVVPNDFGLSTEEVLNCPDKELNQWVSVKKMSQFRTEYEERQDLKKYRKRGRDSKRKTQVLISLATNSDEGASKQEPKEETLGADNSKKSKIETAKVNERQISGTSNDEEPQENVAVQQSPSKERTRHLERERMKDSSGREESLHENSEEKPPRNIATKKTKSVQARLRGFRFKRGEASLKLRKERAAKNRLARFFRGARKDHLGKLTVDRLASYGLDKKKKKH